MTASRLQGALLEQAGFCADLGSPFTARFLTILAGRLTPDDPLGPRLFGWPGDMTSRGDSVPLRLAGAFHALVLSGTAPALAAAYPPHEANDGILRAALLEALRAHADRIGRFLDSPPQTNEVARSAVLIAAAHWLHARHPCRSGSPSWAPAPAPISASTFRPAAPA